MFVLCFSVAYRRIVCRLAVSCRPAILASTARRHSILRPGYAELGMFLEADTELDKIDPFERPQIIRLA